MSLSVLAGETDKGVFEVQRVASQGIAGDARLPESGGHLGLRFERIEFGAPSDRRRAVEFGRFRKRGTLGDREFVTAEATEQIACGHLHEDTSVIHDDAVVDEFLHVLNDMRREEYGRAAAAGIVAQVLHEQSAVTRVESHREIVEDHQIGVLRQNQPQSYL